MFLFLAHDLNKNVPPPQYQTSKRCLKKRRNTTAPFAGRCNLHKGQKASLADSRHVNDPQSLWKRFIQWPRPVNENLLSSRRQCLTALNSPTSHSIPLAITTKLCDQRQKFAILAGQDQSLQSKILHNLK